MCKGGNGCEYSNRILMPAEASVPVGGNPYQLLLLIKFPSAENPEADKDDGTYIYNDKQRILPPFLIDFY